MGTPQSEFHTYSIDWTPQAINWIIDGKTVRRSYQAKGKKAAIHMVSAFAARQRLVLGQVKVAEKSNEIVAIPKLLDMLVIEGAIVTIDGKRCECTLLPGTGSVSEITRGFTGHGGGDGGWRQASSQA